MIDKIIKKLGGFTKDEYMQVVNQQEFLEENNVLLQDKVEKIKDWRRGMPMRANESDIFEKADKWIQRIIN